MSAVDRRPGSLSILFSRDRALQLDATLRSFRHHCREADEAKIIVLFLAGSPAHREQYARLAEEHRGWSNLIWVPQRDFRRDLLSLLSPFDPITPGGRLARFFAALNPRFGFLAGSWLRSGQLLASWGQKILFLVDDNLFVRSFSLCEASRALTDQLRVLGFSLRLGLNTIYCYAMDRAQDLPAFTEVGGGLLKFNWTTAQADFAYPLDVSSSMFRGEQILPLLYRLPFQNPNTLEGRMMARRVQFLRSHPELLCYDQSVTFCNPINKVQTVLPNRSGGREDYSSERLARLFAAGYRLDINAYHGLTPNACHQEVDLVLKKESST